MPDAPTSGWRRALMPARWEELRALLASFDAAGYRIVGLEDWMSEARGRDTASRELVARFDVDQHPRAALRALRVWRGLGLPAGTWYVRWRTADPRLVAALRSAGQHVGLHYETLTRRVLRTQRAPEAEDIEACREELLREIDLFRDRHGPLRSICAHGDTRAPDVRNSDLVDDAFLRRAQVDFEANLVVRGPVVSGRVTDRAPGLGWVKDRTPEQMIERGTSPVLLLLHPNNWAAPLSVRLETLAGPRIPGRVPALVRQRRDVPGG